MRNTTTPEVVSTDGSKVENMTPAGETIPTLGLAPANDPDPAAPRPKRGRPPKETTSTNKGGRPSTRDKIADSLADQYTMLGQLVRLIAPHVGDTIIERAESCAESLAAWADVNPRVRKTLDRTINSAGAFGVLAAHAPIAAAVFVEVKMRPAIGEAGDEPAAAGGFAALLNFGTPA